MMKLPRLFAISCLLIISACNTNDPASNPISVKVVDSFGKPVANATVVIGNQTGAVEAFSNTDARGEARFNFAPPNATVTAASSCYIPSENRTYYNLDVTYDVNVRAVTLTGGGCDQDAGSVNIDVTDEVAGVTSHEVTLGPITYGGSSVTMEFAWSVQDDGNISVVAIGYDDAGNIKGYGYALDRPAVDGSMIPVAIDRTDLAQHAHRFGNVPSSAIEYFVYASLLRKNATTNLPFNFIGGAAPLPATVTTYSPGSFADNHQYGASVDLDRDSDGKADATVGVIRFLRNPSDQLFDFSLTPLIPGNLTFSPGTAGRPIISWSNSDPLSTAQQLSLSQRTTTPQRTSSYYTMTVPASATGLVFPELPDTLAAFRPGAYNSLSLQTLKFDRPTGYGDYLKAMADNNGRFHEAGGLNSYSYSQISRMP